MEEPIIFKCAEEECLGILHSADSSVGVLLVVGGPQYRVGSHRQFVLLARYLAQQGISVLRFDYRGMGDSSGESREFENIDEDIAAAIDTFFSRESSLKTIVIWGLCDAASAALLYAHSDSRVSGVVLLNPWVRSEQGLAKTYLKHYYLQRLKSPEFWRKLFHFDFDISESARSLLNQVRHASRKSQPDVVPEQAGASGGKSYIDRMLDGLNAFQGRALLIYSENDLTADEFRELVISSKPWKKALNARVSKTVTIKGADHTFSSKPWRDQVAQDTAAWIHQNYTNTSTTSG